MALTVSESHDVNTLLHWLLGTHRPGRAPIAPDEAKDAAARLADSANKRLMAGFTGDQVRREWPQRGGDAA